MCLDTHMILQLIWGRNSFKPYSFHQLVGERFSYVRYMKPKNQLFSICGESALAPKWLTVWPKQNSSCNSCICSILGLPPHCLINPVTKKLKAVAYPDRYSEKWKSHLHSIRFIDFKSTNCCQYALSFPGLPDTCPTMGVNAVPILYR